MNNSSNKEADCASIWFLRLERAKNLNDFEAAAEAVRKLRELGVTVKFSRNTKREAASC